MRKSFRLIKSKMIEKDITQIYLSELIGKSSFYIMERMTGRRGWTMEDMYFLMDLLHIPYDQMHIYFPKADLSSIKNA